MARMFLASGLCPTCGRDVARTVSCMAGVQTEAYHCPEHGRLVTTVERMSLYDWVMSRSEPVPA